MKVLLDTCAFIWLCSEPQKFTAATAGLFRKDRIDALYLSDASVLEIALKTALGKIKLPQAPREWIQQQTALWRIQSLPLAQEELFTSAELPRLHKDPFDRLIIATARNYCLPIVTPDHVFSEYEIECIW